MDGDFEMIVINVLNEIFWRGGQVLIVILVVGVLIVGGASGGQGQDGRT